MMPPTSQLAESTIIASHNGNRPISPSSPAAENKSTRPRAGSFIKGIRRLKLGGSGSGAGGSATSGSQSPDGTITTNSAAGSQHSLHTKLFAGSHRLTCNFNDYEYQYPIGQVDELSSGHVARHKITGITVIMKLTNLAATTKYELLQEAQETIMNTMLCRHENILQYWQTFVDDEERLWVITEPVRVGSVRRILDEHYTHGFQNEIIVATILRELLKAVQYLHDHNYIHNNIRCEHLLLDTNGSLKLTGLGQMLQRQSMGKMQRSVYKFCGEPEWMAPEVLSQATTYNEKADIYSVGITAIEMLYGRTPYDGWPALKILLCKLHYQVPLTPVSSSQTLISGSSIVGNGGSVSSNSGVINYGGVFIREGSRQFMEFIERSLHRDPMLRPSAMELLDDSLLRQHARNAHFIDTQLIRKLNRNSATSTMSSTTNPQNNPSSTASNQSYSNKNTMSTTDGSPGSNESGKNFMISSSLGSFPTLQEAD